MPVDVPLNVGGDLGRERATPRDLDEIHRYGRHGVVSVHLERAQSARVGSPDVLLVWTVANNFILHDASVTQAPVRRHPSWSTLATCTFSYISLFSR